jgi:L-ribulose-5-phosphate 3-epimerase
MSNDASQSSRRSFLKSAVRNGIGLPVFLHAAGISSAVLADSGQVVSPTCRTCETNLESLAKPPVCLFSKHLGWITDPQRLAGTIASLGFDAIDLAVRPGGHVLPEKVESDLPRMAAAAKQAGLRIAMITTRIDDPHDPCTEAILKSMASLGIRYYRRDVASWNGRINILDRIAELQPGLRELAALNKKYGVFAGLHNHSGFELGATPWEIFELVKDHDPQYLGSNFDIGHATIEGGIGGWRNGFRLLSGDKRVRMTAIKDFFWQKVEGRWTAQFCPLGQGMIDLKTYLSYLKEIQFAGPISMHFEYPNAGTTLEAQHKSLLEDMKRDLALLRGKMKEARMD